MHNLHFFKTRYFSRNLSISCSVWIFVVKSSCHFFQLKSAIFWTCYQLCVTGCSLSNQHILPPILTQNLTKSVILVWVNWWQNMLIWQRTTCSWKKPWICLWYWPTLQSEQIRSRWNYFTSSIERLISDIRIDKSSKTLLGNQCSVERW